METNAIAKAQPHEVATVSPSNNLLMSVEMDPNTLPDLDDAEMLPINLSANYWTPEKAGEKKRMFFSEINIRDVQDEKNPEVLVQLPVAFFFEKDKATGIINTISNASKRLLAVLVNHNFQKGTPVEITYKGKVKNSTNNYLSDEWSVQPLILKGK